MDLTQHYLQMLVLMAVMMIMTRVEVSVLYHVMECWMTVEYPLQERPDEVTQNTTRICISHTYCMYME